MNFPLQSSIQPVPYGRQNAEVLVLTGNAGLIPLSVQYALLSKDGVMLEQKVVQMTDKQWQGWTSQDDSKYLLECVAELVGVTLISPYPVTTK